MKKSELKRRIRDLEAQIIKLGTYTEEPPGEPSMLFYCECGRRHTFYRPHAEHVVVINQPGGDL